MLIPKRVGTIVNFFGVLISGLLGLLVKRGIPKRISDAIVAAFGAHKVNFSDFSNDLSSVVGNAGSIIRVPLIGKTGGAKTANADGTDDFSIGSKTTQYKDIELALKYVTCP